MSSDLSEDTVSTHSENEIGVDRRRRLDVDLLISLVEKRPILWDKTLDTFSDRIKKRESWREVFVKMKPGFEDLERKDQRLIGQNIEKKWKYIKDAYFRTLKENKPKSGDRMSIRRKKNYIYHNELRFLTKTVVPKETTIDIPEQHSKENDEIQLFTSEINLPVQVQNNDDGLKKKHKKKFRNVKDTFIEYLEEVTKQNKVQCNSVQKDEHEMFFNSILPFVRQFDGDQTLAFRAEMIRIIQKIKRDTNNSTV